MAFDVKTVAAEFLRRRQTGELKVVKPKKATPSKSGLHRVAPLPRPGAPGWQRRLTLNAEAPKAEIVINSRRQHRLVVAGCGSANKKGRGKRTVLEALALGMNYALARWGVTCDGEAVLPTSTKTVRLVLLDRNATVDAVVEARPEGARKKYAPKGWITRRTIHKATWKKPRPKPAI